MSAPHSRQDRAAEAASYADRLQADLISLSDRLDHYRDNDSASSLETLRERSLASQQLLQAIARRIDGLGGLADAGKYPLSDREHAVIDDARGLRDEMMDTLSRLQRT